MHRAHARRTRSRSGCCCAFHGTSAPLVISLTRDRMRLKSSGKETPRWRIISASACAYWVRARSGRPGAVLNATGGWVWLGQSEPTGGGAPPDARILPRSGYSVATPGGREAPDVRHDCSATIKELSSATIRLSSGRTDTRCSSISNRLCSPKRSPVKPGLFGHRLRRLRA